MVQIILASRTKQLSGLAVLASNLIIGIIKAITSRMDFIDSMDSIPLEW